MEKPTYYASYVVRLWPTEIEGHLQCRATLDAVLTGERHDFRQLEDLIAFLRDEEALLIQIADPLKDNPGHNRTQ